MQHRKKKLSQVARFLESTKNKRLLKKGMYTLFFSPPRQGMSLTLPLIMDEFWHQK